MQRKFMCVGCFMLITNFFGRVSKTPAALKSSNIDFHIGNRARSFSLNISERRRYEIVEIFTPKRHRQAPPLGLIMFQQQIDHYTWRQACYIACFRCCGHLKESSEFNDNVKKCNENGDFVSITNGLAAELCPLPKLLTCCLLAASDVFVTGV